MSSFAAIDTYLAGDTTINLLRPYGAGDMGAEVIRCCKTVHVPDLYICLLLGNNLTPVEAWNLLQRAIVDAAAKAAGWPVIDWLHAAIVRSSPGTFSALVVPELLATLPDTLLPQHRHRILRRHLPGLYPSVNCAAGLVSQKRSERWTWS